MPCSMCYDSTAPEPKEVMVEMKKEDGTHERETVTEGQWRRCMNPEPSRSAD